MKNYNENQYMTPVPTPRKIGSCFLNNSSMSSFECNNETVNITENLLHKYESSTYKSSPIPRKPRSRSQTLNHRNRHKHNNLAYSNSSSSSMRQLLLTPTFRREPTCHDSNSSMSVDGGDYKHKQSLQRPNAPPPPPPPAIGFTALQLTNELEKQLFTSFPNSQHRFEDKALNVTLNSFDFYGFENFVYKTDNSPTVDNATKTVPSLLVHNAVPIKTKNETKPTSKIFPHESRKKEINRLDTSVWCKLVDLVTLMLTLSVLAACIVFIVFFQTHVHRFYQGFFDFNLNNTMTVNDSVVDIKTASANTLRKTVQSNDSKPVFEQPAHYMHTAGSKLIDQTVLFCNSPYLSNQMTNILVLPLSLCLVLVFSLFTKRETCYPSVCGGRPGIPASINPFMKRNRFVSAAIFCILANEIFKMTESSIFDSSRYDGHRTFNNTNELFKYIADGFQNLTKDNTASNSDFFAIGLGMEPRFMQQQQQQQQSEANRNMKMNNTTRKPAYILGPATVKYPKPKLPPRLDISPQYANKIIVEQQERQKSMRLHRKNKTWTAIHNLSNTTIQDGKMMAFNGTMLNMSAHQLLAYAYNLTYKLPTFKWTFILDKLETIAIKLVEVILIGLRYYPLLGVLDKDSIVCLALGAIYMWLDIVYNLFTRGLCEGLKLNTNFSLVSDLFESVFHSVLHFNTLTKQLVANKRTLFSSSRIMYTIVKSLPHFFCLSYVAVRLTCTLFGKLRKKCLSKYCCFGPKLPVNGSRQGFSTFYLNDGKKANAYRNMFETSSHKRNVNDYDTVRKFHSNYRSRRIVQTKETFELKYVRNLFKMTRNFKELVRLREKYTLTRTNKHMDCVSRVLKQVWCRFFWLNDENFRFSTSILCTYTVCFTVLYYFNCVIVFYATTFIDSVYVIPVAYKAAVLFSLLFTSSLMVMQLFGSLRCFRANLIALYKGVKQPDLPDFKLFTPEQNRTILLNSFNYAGYTVTHMCWGFVMLFMLVLFVSLNLATVYLIGNTRLSLFLIVVLAPFLFSAFFLTFVSKLISKIFIKFCFTQKNTDYLALKNYRSYGFYLYFKFFYDCFMGFAICIKRMIKTIVLSVLFVSRMDHSCMGRNLESMDSAFMAYVGHLYWESRHTNPILIAFCSVLKETSSHSVYMHREEKSFYLKKNRVVNRWHLCRLLIKNKSLIECRKRGLGKKLTC